MSDLASHADFNPEELAEYCDLTVQQLGEYGPLPNKCRKFYEADKGQFEHYETAYLLACADSQVGDDEKGWLLIMRDGAKYRLDKSFLDLQRATASAKQVYWSKKYAFVQKVGGQS